MLIPKIIEVNHVMLMHFLRYMMIWLSDLLLRHHMVMDVVGIMIGLVQLLPPPFCRLFDFESHRSLWQLWVCVCIKVWSRRMLMRDCWLWQGRTQQAFQTCHCVKHPYTHTHTHTHTTHTHSVVRSPQPTHKFKRQLVHFWTNKPTLFYHSYHNDLIPILL